MEVTMTLKIDEIYKFINLKKIDLKILKRQRLKVTKDIAGIHI